MSCKHNWHFIGEIFYKKKKDGRLEQDRYGMLYDITHAKFVCDKCGKTKYIEEDKGDRK